LERNSLLNRQKSQHFKKQMLRYTSNCFKGSAAEASR
jgi:hypothetical protein